MNFMKKASKSRRQKLVVPDKKTWERDFRNRLADSELPRLALAELTDQGCLEESLLDLFYAYLASPVLVFDRRQKARKQVLDGLKRVIGRLDRGSKEMQGTLDVEMMEGWNLARLLQERALFKLPDGTTTSAPVFPDFAIDMPKILALHSRQLKWLRSQLQKSLQSRQVQNTIYLAEMASS